MDEKFALVDKYDQSISFAHSVDEKFGINNAIGKFSESACDYLQKLIDYFQDNIAPKLVRALKLFILKARVYWELFKINSQYYSTLLLTNYINLDNRLNLLNSLQNRLISSMISSSNWLLLRMH